MDSGQHTNAADDSDNDTVTDFLNSNCSLNASKTDAGGSLSNGLLASAAFDSSLQKCSNIPTVESQNYCIPIINAPPITANNNNNNNNNNSNNNMIPTINVTPHSPANIAKYNNIFEDTLNQLQSIRESVVQMKNASTQMHDGLSNCGLLNAAILSASLPDLSAAISGGSGGGGGGGAGGGGVGVAGTLPFMWSPQQQQQYLLKTDRRKSWTAIDDLTAGGEGGANKSVSLSSLDSEEQETVRVTERRRSARNSTGGISTHSLNEAELARDFERIAAKRSLNNEVASRIPLQKSISTSSIVAKEEIKAIARHLTDSEDENQSLLRAHTKIEVYDNVEKRRKRGSLFFRKKKDKAKGKSVGGQVNTCDVCGANLTLASLKDHHPECKGQNKKSGGGGGGGGGGAHQKTTGSTKRNNSIAADKCEVSGQDFFDGPEPLGNFNDDTPLIRHEFLNDPPIEAQDLGADPALGIELKEHDSWSPGVPKEVLKALKEAQIKRQEHIYEFIMTEKHHCQTLLVIQKVFVESLERHFPALNCNKMFPRLAELTDLHTAFLKKLRHKQREHYVINSIADVLLDFFSLEKAQHLRLAYGEFCANHRTALELFKACMTSRDPTFSEWYKHCLTNRLLKKKGIPECILFVTQRLTKYPLLIEPLLKSARDDKLETEKLQHALTLVKELLVDVDACVAEKELRERQIDIYNRIDAKSFAIYKNKPFRKCDIGVESRRRLKFEGLATLMQGRSKMQLVLVVVLTDCLCFLVENSAHNKYTFFTPDHKAGVVPLQKLLIREKAGTESRGIYIISSNPLFPEMYELKVQTPKDKNTWIQSIRQAVLDCPSSDIIEAEDLTAEEKLRIGMNKREIIEKMRQKDIEQALLLEEKIILQLNLMQKDQRNFAEDQQQQQQQQNIGPPMSAANFLAAYGSYKDLNVGADCDTGELWKRVLNIVQDISQLASMVYTAATGLPVSRSVSSVGEKQSDSYASPTLPKRAETFAGFDERRAKNNFPCREAAKLATLQIMNPKLQELEEKRETKSSPIFPATNDQTPQTDHSQAEPQAVKDYNFALLQVSHNLHTLLCIISQQMTTIHSLQLQLALYRESPRAVYTHNDQLEELRNLQDKLQEEKTAWMRQKEQQEQELGETRAQLDKLQAHVKAEQEDIKQQREQLYRKMEVLSSQGLLLSPNTPLMISSPVLHAAANNDDHDAHENHGHNISLVDAPQTFSGGGAGGGGGGGAMSTIDRRKDKWRTASTISKTPPVNLLSATNAPKVSQTCVKQKIPIKLSSLSSTCTTSATHSASGAAAKVDKSASFNSGGTASVITQMFPLKLADKRSIIHAATAPQLAAQHSRTGSSPAIIQHPQSAALSSGSAPTLTSPPSNVTRTDSVGTFAYGHRYSNVGGTPTSSRSSTQTTTTTSGAKLVAVASASALLSNAVQSSPPGARHVQIEPDEEEIYF